MLSARYQLTARTFNICNRKLNHPLHTKSNCRYGQTAKVTRFITKIGVSLNIYFLEYQN